MDGLVGPETGRSRPRLRWLLPLTIYALVAVSSLATVRYGQQFDQSFHTSMLKSVLRNGALLPGQYVYPSLTYAVLTLVSVPEIREERRGGPEAAGLAQDLIFERPFQLRARISFALIGALGIFWVFYAAVALGLSTGEAAVGAALYGFSFELFYHLPWIAPDMLMVQFAALSLWLLARAQRHGASVGSLLALAAGAALTAGSKYNGGLVVLPGLVLLAERLLQRGLRKTALWGSLLTFLGFCGVYAATFLSTTPAFVVNFRRVMFRLLEAGEHYGRGHFGHTVAPGWEHLSLVTTWITWELLSSQAWIAVFLSALALVGFLSLGRSVRSFLLWVLVPILFLLIMTSAAVMILRNLMFILPYMALAAAVGYAKVQKRYSTLPFFRWAFGAVVTATLVFNGVYLVQAARSMNSADLPAQELASYLRRHPDQPIVLSLAVQKALSSQEDLDIETLRIEPWNEDARVLVHTSELGRRIRVWLPANRRNTYKAFGPRDINIDYYPSWPGRHRIFMFSMAEFRKMRTGPTKALTRPGRSGLLLVAGAQHRYHRVRGPFLGSRVAPSCHVINRR